MYLWISMCGNIVDTIARLLSGQKDINCFPLSLLSPAIPNFPSVFLFTLLPTHFCIPVVYDQEHVVRQRYSVTVHRGRPSSFHLPRVLGNKINVITRIAYEPWEASWNSYVVHSTSQPPNSSLSLPPPPPKHPSFLLPVLFGSGFQCSYAGF